MYNSQIVTERIKNAAKANGITMEYLNSSCNLSKNTISNAGKSSEGMKAKNLYMIAEFLNVSTDYLLGKTDTPNNITNGDISHSSVAQASGSNNRISIQSKNEYPYSEVIEHLDNLSPAERRHAIADLMDVLENQYPIKKK